MTDLYYWACARLFPELSLFETEEERKVAFRETVRSLTGVIPYCLLLGLLFGLGLPLVGSLSFPLQIGALVLPGFALMCLFIVSSQRKIHRELWRRLAESGVPICLKCGYDLRGQIEARCPECGTPFSEERIAP